MLFSTFFIWQLVSYALSMMRLMDMYRFYTHLLHIPDEDIQTISWPEVVRRIGAIREDNPLTALSSNTAAHQSVTAKLDAMRAHASQITPDGQFFAMGMDLAAITWGTEYYRLAKGTRGPRGESGFEEDLFAGLG